MKIHVSKFVKIIAVFISILLPSLSHAGLLGFMANVKTLTSSSGSTTINQVDNISINNNIKAQKGLSILGFYMGNYDGNLNTYDSRSAISSFQNDLGYDEKKSIYTKGILSEITKNNLIYVYELADEFDRIVFENYKVEVNDLSRLKLLYKAMLDLEKRLSKNKTVINVISKSMNNEIHNPSIVLTSKRNLYFDSQSRRIWQDESFSKKMYTYNEAQAYCKKLTLNGINTWEAPSPQLFKDAFEFPFKFIPRDEKGRRYNSWYLFWTSENHYRASLKNNSIFKPENNNARAFVRCVVGR